MNVCLSSTGFDLSPVGDRQNLYGRGCYFSEQTAHSDKRDKHVLLQEGATDADERFAQLVVVRVAAGLMELRTRDRHIMKPTHPYHSVRGVVTEAGERPMTAVVVYETTQAYPAYIVTYVLPRLVVGR